MENDVYFYAMELVEGENLSQQLSNEGRVEAGEAVKIIRQIAKALEYIHSYQFIHGEVNPRNIVIRQDGVAKLLDLGSSCSIQQEVRSKGKLTKMPQYMAPEQIQPDGILNVRTDIYCLGATFYRILTGHPPVSGKNIEEIKKNIVEQEPTPINQVDYTIPEDLTKIVHRMIRKDAQKRYAEIKNVLFALKKILL
jgi:serine/threonine protein kinase